MLARTRMCRTMVAIMREGNLGGAVWQRPQLERNRFSPSKCRFSSCVELVAAVVAAAVELFAVVFAGAVEFLPSLDLAAAPIASNMANARKAVDIAVLILITCFLMAPAASQTGTSCRLSRDWRCCPEE